MSLIRFLQTTSLSTQNNNKGTNGRERRWETVLCWGSISLCKSVKWELTMEKSTFHSLQSLREIFHAVPFVNVEKTLEIMSNTMNFAAFDDDWFYNFSTRIFSARFDPLSWKHFTCQCLLIQFSKWNGEEISRGIFMQTTFLRQQFITGIKSPFHKDSKFVKFMV